MSLLLLTPHSQVPLYSILTESQVKQQEICKLYFLFFIVINKSMDNLTNEQCQALIDSVTTWENVSLTRNISGMYKDIPRGGELKFKQSEVDFWKDTHPDMLLEFVMKYESGDYCGLHIDSNWWVVKKPYIAMTTWITPLNDGYDGGELYVNGEFVEQVVGVPVKFPRTTEHEITEVTNGTRYSLVSWQFGEA